MTKTKKEYKSALDDTNHKGDTAELLAAAWLMKQGFRVFRNLGCTGPVDLMIHDKYLNVTLVQVKSTKKRYQRDLGYEAYKLTYTDMDKDLANNIKPLWVDIEKSRVGWNINAFEKGGIKYR